MSAQTTASTGLPSMLLSIYKKIRERNSEINAQRHVMREKYSKTMCVYIVLYTYSPTYFTVHTLYIG
jgi:hypothetical protein